jgi:hypothetical protein
LVLDLDPDGEAVLGAGLRGQREPFLRWFAGLIGRETGDGPLEAVYVTADAHRSGATSGRTVNGRSEAES